MKFCQENKIYNMINNNQVMFFKRNKFVGLFQCSQIQRELIPFNFIFILWNSINYDKKNRINIKYAIWKKKYNKWRKYTFHKKTCRNRRNKLLSPVIALDLWWGGILLSHKIKVMIDIRDSNRNRNVILLPNCVGWK